MRSLILLFLLAGLAPCRLQAQVKLTKSKAITQQPAIYKDTSYKAFQAKLRDIMKTASGRKTNFAAVKTFFENNRVMLQGLKKRYNITGASSGNGNKYIAMKDKPLAGLANVQQLYTSNFTDDGPFNMRAYYYAIEWEVIEQPGKLVWNSPNFSTTNGSFEIGPSAFVALNFRKVPDAREIVGMRLEFHYSFEMGGWDSEGGETTARLVFQANPNTFQSTAYNSLPDNHMKGSIRYDKNMKSVATLFHKKTTDYVDDFSFSKDTVFTIEGYVTPGDNNIGFSIGIAYDETKTGGDGAYHFGEFTLKKIVVHYLKAGD